MAVFKLKIDNSVTTEEEAGHKNKFIVKPIDFKRSDFQTDGYYETNCKYYFNDYHDFWCCIEVVACWYTF